MNGFLCATDRTAAVRRQHDLGSGGLYLPGLVRNDGVTPVDGQFWALNFGAKKSALAMEESRSVDGPNGRGSCRPDLWIKDDDFAITRAAPDGPGLWARTLGQNSGADLWGDARVEVGPPSAPTSARRCTRRVWPRSST